MPRCARLSCDGARGLIFGYEGWTIGGLPTREVGFIFIGIGILEALRGIVFRGGLFGRRSKSSVDRGEEAGGRPWNPATIRARATRFWTHASRDRALQIADELGLTLEKTMAADRWDR